MCPRVAVEAAGIHRDGPDRQESASTKGHARWHGIGDARGLVLRSARPAPHTAVTTVAGTRKADGHVLNLESQHTKRSFSLDLVQTMPYRRVCQNTHFRLVKSSTRKCDRYWRNCVPD